EMGASAPIFHLRRCRQTDIDPSCNGKRAVMCLGLNPDPYPSGQEAQMIRQSLLSVVSILAVGAAAQAQDAQEFPALLIEHAQVPAQTFLPAPADAPAGLNISGRFAGGERSEAPYSVIDANS